MKRNTKTKAINLMNIKSFILPFFIMILLCSGVFALDTLGTFIRGDNVKITQVCSDATYINITSISYPNSTTARSNVNMTSIDGEFAYNFNDTNLNGRYDVRGISDGCEGEFATYFLITPNGKEFSDAGGTAAFAILFGVVALIFFFSIMGFRMINSDKLVPLGFFFIVLSLILVIYSLNLAWVYSYDIMAYDNLSNVTEGIYITFLWLITGVGIISMALMLVAFIKELGTVKKAKDFGDGFNPVTDTYDF